MPGDMTWRASALVARALRPPLGFALGARLGLLVNRGACVVIVGRCSSEYFPQIARRMRLRQMWRSPFVAGAVGLKARLRRLRRRQKRRQKLTKQMRRGGWPCRIFIFAATLGAGSPTSDNWPAFAFALCSLYCGKKKLQAFGIATSKFHRENIFIFSGVFQRRTSLSQGAYG